MADAMGQYRRDRDPREKLFTFKQRTLVHFAVDTEEVYMTTRLAGSATHFLPFNQGNDSGAGNPTDPEGRNYRTAYLWETVLQPDSLLDLLARFLHIQVEDKFSDDGKKVKKETLIFPRYHQLQAVRSLVTAAASEGPGHNYLIEHSAGSGKSNTIGWLAHRLSALHNANDQRVFDSAIVVTDRVVLDRQLQNTIYQFDHRQGVVQKIEEDSRQLAEALENAVPIIITTLQKFPFVAQQLEKMAAERGGTATATPKYKTLAVFGREGESFSRYTMRQAIEEGFIMDVLKNYITYKTFYRLLKACEDDPNVERKKAARALSRYLRLHPHNIAQKTELIVEHFQNVSRHKIGGRDKAMVVTGSRLEAVRYKQAFDQIIAQKGYAIKTLVAFSGQVPDDKVPDKTYTEVEMNGGIREKDLPAEFATQ